MNFQQMKNMDSNLKLDDVQFQFLQILPKEVDELEIESFNIFYQ
jgi:hypothetical protein